MIEVLSRVLDRVQFRAGFVGDFFAVPNTVDLEDSGGVCDVDPLKLLDASVVLSNVSHWMLDGEAEVHILVQAEHLISLKTVLVSTGVEFDAHLFEFSRGPEPTQIPDGRDVARVGEVVKTGCPSQAVQLGSHDCVF